MYPVAPGSSVTFINENAPYCYTKTVDMSQLDRPKFEKYRLVKEDDPPAQKIEQSPDYATKDDLRELTEQMMLLRGRVDILSKKRKDRDDDDE